MKLSTHGGPVARSTAARLPAGCASRHPSCSIAAAAISTLPQAQLIRLDCSQSNAPPEHSCGRQWRGCSAPSASPARVWETAPAPAPCGHKAASETNFQPTVCNGPFALAAASWIDAGDAPAATAAAAAAAAAVEAAAAAAIALLHSGAQRAKSSASLAATSSKQLPPRNKQHMSRHTQQQTALTLGEWCPASGRA